MFSMILIMGLIHGVPNSINHEIAHSRVKIGMSSQEVDRLHGGRKNYRLYGYSLLYSHHLYCFGHRNVEYVFESLDLKGKDRLTSINHGGSIFLLGN